MTYKATDQDKRNLCQLYHGLAWPWEFKAIYANLLDLLCNRLWKDGLT